MANNKGGGLCGCVGGILGLLLLIGVLSPHSDKDNTGGDTSAVSTPSQGDTPQVVQDHPDLAGFGALIPVVDGQTNDDKPLPKLRNFHYDPSTRMARVEMNMDQNLTQNLANEGVKMLVSDCYIALYHGGGPPINLAQVRVYGPLVDKYGNTTQDVIYDTKLPSSEAAKVNWATDKSDLEMNILPGIWNVSYDFHGSI